MARFCPLFSGSSGNSTYIGTQGAGILVDVGVSAKRLCQALEQRNIPLSSIEGVFITHLHSDHICGLSTFLKKNNIPIFASEKTVEGLPSCVKLPESQKIIVVDRKIQTDFFSVERFDTSHDSEGSSGYTFDTGEEKMAVCTDLGIVTDEVRGAIKGSDLVMLESNHDLEMLRRGPYPPLLKIRVSGEQGHLSNIAASAELPELMKSGAKQFVLAHLSRENNTPEKAVSAARASLADIMAVMDRDYRLTVAKIEGGEIIAL